MNRKYQEVKEDYYKLVELCDGSTVQDYCGAWCNNDMMTMLLDDPKKSTAAYMFSSLISSMYRYGSENSTDHNSNSGDKLNLMNAEIHAILVRNGDL